MMKEEQLLEKRLIELSKTSYHRDIVMFSDFLNLNERNILHTLPKDLLYADYVTFGGYDLAERQMAAFIPDALSLRTEQNHEYREENFAYPIDFPFKVMSIKPLNSKYAENLTHRDYLGAILNLGIDRSKLGDILVENDRTVIFVHNSLAQFLCDELTRVRHTNVILKELSGEEFSYTPKIEEITGTVASIRLDSLLSLAFSSSRSKLTGLIEGGKVFVNGRLMTTNSYQVKDNDVISARGMGKFKYEGSGAKTKKNRLFVTIHKYI